MPTLFQPNNINPNIMGAPTPIEAKDTGYTITWAELTSIPKTFTCDSASNRTFDFAVPVAGDVGKSFRVVKTGTDAGNITIDAPSTIYIEDSTDGGTVTGEAAARCSITLQLVTATKLAVISATGTWVTA